MHRGSIFERLLRGIHDQAAALESLTQAIRHFIFVVPAGLGVQEAGLVGFGYLLSSSAFFKGTGHVRSSN